MPREEPATNAWKPKNRRSPLAPCLIAAALLCTAAALLCAAGATAQEPPRSPEAPQPFVGEPYARPASTFLQQPPLEPPHAEWRETDERLSDLERRFSEKMAQEEAVRREVNKAEMRQRVAPPKERESFRHHIGQLHERLGDLWAQKEEILHSMMETSEQQMHRLRERLDMLHREHDEPDEVLEVTPGETAEWEGLTVVVPRLVEPEGDAPWSVRLEARRPEAEPEELTLPQGRPLLYGPFELEPIEIIPPGVEDQERGLVRFAVRRFPPEEMAERRLAAKDREIGRLEEESEHLAARLREESDRLPEAEREEIERDLRENLERVFELKMEMREHEEQMIARELEEFRNRSAMRREHRAEIIDRRMRQMLGEGEWMEW